MQPIDTKISEINVMDKNSIVSKFQIKILKIDRDSRGRHSVTASFLLCTGLKVTPPCISKSMQPINTKFSWINGMYKNAIVSKFRIKILKIDRDSRWRHSVTASFLLCAGLKVTHHPLYLQKYATD